MVFVIGGWALTQSQMRTWAEQRGLDTTTTGIGWRSNDWIEEQGPMLARVLAVDIKGECWFIFITDEKGDRRETAFRFDPLLETDAAREAKREYGLPEEVQYVNVPNPIL